MTASVQLLRAQDGRRGMWCHAADLGFRTADIAGRGGLTMKAVRPPLR